MTTQPIRTLVYFEVKPDQIETFTSLIAELCGPTQAEDGCRRYELQQSVDNPSQFVCVEEWDTADALAEHVRSEHVQRVSAALRDTLAEPLTVRRYKAVWPV